LFAIACVIALGLWIRSGAFPKDSAWVKYGGDALWAVVVFLCIGVACKTSTTLKVGLIAVGVSWSVEFLQLYHEPWIDRIRANFLGRLILGDTFNPPDLLAYVVGIVLAGVLEWICVGPGRRGAREVS
jgi:hypothetical protein